MKRYNLEAYYKNGDSGVFPILAADLREAGQKAEDIIGDIKQEERRNICAFYLEDEDMGCLGWFYPVKFNGYINFYFGFK